MIAIVRLPPYHMTTAKIVTLNSDATTRFVGNCKVNFLEVESTAQRSVARLHGIVGSGCVVAALPAYRHAAVEGRSTNAGCVVVADIADAVRHVDGVSPALKQWGLRPGCRRGCVRVGAAAQAGSHGGYHESER